MTAHCHALVCRFVTVGLLFATAITAVPAAEPVLQTDNTQSSQKAEVGPARWEAAIRKFEAMDKKLPPRKGGVLLVGGSNARRWAEVDDHFPDHHVLNRGFGGARLSDVLHFADRIILPYSPEVVLVNAGGNDLGAGKSPEQIQDTARALVNKIRVTLPDTRICFVGLPLVRRAHQRQEVRGVIVALNNRLKSLAENEDKVEFVDLVPSFLDENEAFATKLFVKDGVHFSSAGYTVLAERLRDKL